VPDKFPAVVAVVAVVALVAVPAFPEMFIPAVPLESFVGSSDEPEVNKVAEAGIVVLFTEVTFGSEVVAVVIPLVTVAALPSMFTPVKV
jgi:hypothetical protein